MRAYLGKANLEHTIWDASDATPTLLSPTLFVTLVHTVEISRSSFSFAGMDSMLEPT
jgi:hypothetical protein